MNFIKKIIKPKQIINKQIINLAAGPTQLSENVKKQAAKALINYNNSGRSICEITHFEDEWKNIYNKTISITKEFLKIPESHECFYMNGGGNHQFAALFYNLCDKNSTIQVLIDGYWSKKASEEFEKFCNVQKVYKQKDLIDSPAYVFTYYCENETIKGFEHRNGISFKPTKHLLICDTCSILGSKQMDIQNFDVIFSSLSKNLGIAGSSLVILNKNIIKSEEFNNISNIPSVMNWNFVLNNIAPTPNNLSIYLTYLNIKEMINNGGLNFYNSYNINKSKLLYNYIDTSNFYTNNISIINRSRTNIVFNIKNSNFCVKDFVDFCELNGIYGILGHKFNTSHLCRVSLYNSVSIDNVYYLIKIMEKYKKKNYKNNKKLWRKTKIQKY